MVRPAKEEVSDCIAGCSGDGRSSKQIEDVNVGAERQLRSVVPALVRYA